MDVKRFRGEGFIILSAAGFGIMPVLAKLTYRTGNNVNQVLLYRFIIASILLWTYVFIKGKDYKIGKNNIFYLGILGILGYSTTAVLAFTSFRFISAGLADLLLFLYPPIIVLIRRAFFKERIQKAGALALILSILGIGLIVWTPQINYDTVGVILGLLSALSYSFYVLSIGSKRIQDVDAVVITAYIVTFCSAGIFVYSLITQAPIGLPDLSGLLFISMLALLSTVLPILFFCMGVKIIGSSRASIVSTIEPAFATLAGAVVLGESISGYTIIGGFFIISGIILLQIRRRGTEVIEKGGYQ